MKALEQKINDDYTTFSGLALERWFRQELTESCRYRRIGGWWMSGGKNVKGTQDDFEIDIVAETIDGDVEVYEVKRNATISRTRRYVCEAFRWMIWESRSWQCRP